MKKVGLENSRGWVELEQYPGKSWRRALSCPRERQALSCWRQEAEPAVEGPACEGSATAPVTGPHDPGCHLGAGSCPCLWARLVWLELQAMVSELALIWPYPLTKSPASLGTRAVSV